MKKIIKFILLICWMIFIYYMSSLNSDVSSNQSGLIVNYISRIFSINNIDLITYIVRKSAHIFEYFVLYALFYINIKELKLNNYEIICIILAIVYSLTDELHQLFVSGRACQPQDIIIDLIGILIGYIFCKFYYNIKYKKLKLYVI